MNWTDFHQYIVTSTLSDWRDVLLCIAALKFIFSPRLSLEGINHSLAWVAECAAKASKRMGK